MTDDRAHALARAAERYIERHGGLTFWRATAIAAGINSRTFSNRVAAGMDPEAAAKHADTLKQPNPHSIRQRCFALGYRTTSSYHRVREELVDMGLEHSVDDVFEILAARRASK